MVFKGLLDLESSNTFASTKFWGTNQGKGVKNVHKKIIKFVFLYSGLYQSKEFSKKQENIMNS